MPRFQIQVSDFGRLSSGKAVKKLTLLDQDTPTKIAVSPYGATLVGASFPDMDNKPGEVVLGFDDAAAYERGKSSQGATVGRWAGRIGNASFELDGVTYKPTRNLGTSCLHGGDKGFNKHDWLWYDKKEGDDYAKVEFFTLSGDGEEGFPGEVRAHVSYYLTPFGMKIKYKAKTDKPTIINLTNHTYFNLAGTDGKTVNDQFVCIDAPYYLETGEELIPTGTFMPVWGDTDNKRPKALQMDLRQPKKIGEIEYDHSYAFEDDGGWHTAFFYDKQSGRLLTLRTTERCAQFYTANHLGEGKNGGKDGEGLIYRQGACFEAQRFPDAPNKKGALGVYRLDPNLTYKKTDYYFFNTIPDLNSALEQMKSLRLKM